MSDAEKDLCNPSTLREAISEVFSTMVFMDITPGPIEEELDGPSCMMGTISFTGIFNGALSICCSTPCAKEITMNLLAFEDEDEMQESDIPDAVGEVSNMVMGTLKTKLYDQLGEIAVSVPTVVSGASMKNQLRAGEVKLSAAVGIADQYCMHVNLVYQVGENNE